MYPKNVKDIEDPTVRARVIMERKIVTKLIDNALAAGYTLRVDQGACNDPEEYTDPTTDRAAVIDAIMECDEDRLFYEKDGYNAGWVFLVYGNDGWDVICDYSIFLEDHLKPVLDYCEVFEGAA